MKKMWKRFVSLLLACTLLAGMLPLSASAAVSAPGEDSDQYKYAKGILDELNGSLELSEEYTLSGPFQLKNSEVYIYELFRTIQDDSGHRVTDTRYVIVPGEGATQPDMPDYENGQDGQPWAESNPSAVYIADGVTGIGNHAFDGMSTLETIEFENSKSLTKVGEYAFNNCDKMVGLSLDLSNVTTLGKYAFNGCERLGSGENNKGVTLNDALTTIPENAFNTCGLKNVNIPKSCTKIEKNAFAHNSLSEVGELVLPDGLVTIGDSAFVVTMGSGDTSVGITSLTIPSSVKSIGANAFSGRRNLAEVTVEDDNVPNTQLTLGNAAFGFNESSAFSEWGSITDDRTGQKYEGTMGTKFYLPADLTEKFINGTNCYTGDIEPMKWVKTQQPTCDTDGYHLYETTKKGAYDDEGKPLVLQYKYTIPMLGHDWNDGEPIPASCERNSYTLYTCKREGCGDTYSDNFGQDATGHEYTLISVTNPSMGNGQSTTFKWVCQKSGHDETRDGKPITVEISVSPSPISATTTTKYGELQLPKVNGGTLSLAADVNEDELLEIGDKSVHVVYTPDDVAYAGYTGMGPVDNFDGADLVLQINVSKTKLDFSSVRFGNCLVGINPGEEETVPITIERGNLPEDVEAGDPVYTEHESEEGSTIPPSIGENWTGTVSVTFNYDPNKYEEETNNLPEEYKYSRDPNAGTVTITHSYVVTKLEMTNVSATAIPDLAYTGSPMETVHVYGIPAGSTVSWEWESTTDSSVTGTGLVENESLPNLQIAEITNAGTYDVTITITNKSYETYTLPNPVTVTIQKAKVETPKPKKDLVYTSHELIGLDSPDENAKYSYQKGSELVGTNAGTYTATAVLADTANYEWAESDNDGDGAVTISWNIAKRPVIETSITEAFKNVRYDGTVKRAVSEPTNATNFFTVSYVNGTLIGKVASNQDKDAFTIMHAEETNAGTYDVTATITDFENFYWQNHAQEESYSLGSWTINALQIAAPTITAEDATYTGAPYAGEVALAHSNSSSGIINLDATTISYYAGPNDETALENTPVNAGNYYAGVENWAFEDGKLGSNYQIIVRGEARDGFTITKAPATMKFEKEKQEETYTAQGTDLQQVKVTNLVTADEDKPASEVYTVTYTYKYKADDKTNWEEVKTETKIEEPSSFKFTKVGEYKITAKFTSNNYTATDATYTLTITQAEDQSITLTSADANEGTWELTEKTYTTIYGSEKTFTVTGTAALDNASISYAVNGDSNVVSVDGSSGVVTIHKAGTATITVTAAETPNVGAASVDYTVTVKKAEPTVNTGLEGDELTVAYTGKAIEGYDKATPTANVVEGADQPFGDITYTFYTDSGCSDENKVTNGGGKDGNIPIAVGTYYMKATYPGDTNYESAVSEVVTVIVTEAQLTVDAEGYTGTYDGETHSAITIKSVTGKDSDLSYEVYYMKGDGTDAPAAENEGWSKELKVKDVANSGKYWYKVVITGEHANDYAPYIASAQVTISAKELQLTGVLDAYTKTYDGKTNITEDLSITVTTGTSDAITVSSATGTYDNKNAGEGKTVTLTLSLSGTEIKWDNYSYNGAAPTDGKITLTKDDAGTINPKAITVTGISAVDRVYDGTTDVQLTGTPATEDTLFNEDGTVFLALAEGAKGQLQDATAGNGKAVSVGNDAVEITGEGSGNYSVTVSLPNLTVDITPRPVTLQFPNGNSSMTTSYDPNGLTSKPNVYKVSAVAPAEGTGFVSSDALADGDIQYTFKQDNKDVENPINVGEYTVTAELTDEAAKKWSNYTIEAITGTVKIIQATEELTVTVTEKTGLTYTGQGQDPIQSISVKGGNVTLSEDDGDYKVQFKLSEEDDYELDRDQLTAAVKDAKEYTVYWQVTTTNYGNKTDSFTVKVAPATLTLSSSLTKEKEYDGTTAAVVTEQKVTGAQSGENITVSSVSAAYNDANEGTDKTITTTYKVTFDVGVTPGNYTIGNSGAQTTHNDDGTWTVTTKDTGSISAKSITVTIADKNKIYDGKTPSVTSDKGTDWTVDAGALCSQNGTVDELRVVLSVESDGNSAVGTYAIIGEADNKNYDVTFAGSWKGEEHNGTAGTYTIDPRPIDVQIGDTEGFYGDAPVLTGVTLTYEVTDEENHRGLAPDENSVPNITLGTGASAQSPVAGYVIYAVDGNNGQIQNGTSTVIGNYEVTFTKNGTYTVKQRPITITIADQESDYGCEIAKLAYSETLSNTYTGTNENVVFVGDDETDLKIALFTTAKKGSDAGTYPISGEAKAESSVVSNYAITWKGQTPYQENEEQATYTVKKATLAVEFTNEEVTVSMGGTVNNPLKFINQSNSDEELGGQPQDVTVKYSSNDQGVATVNETTGEITLVGTGNATITAEVTSGGKNFTEGAKDSYIIHVAEDGGLLVTVTPKTLTYTGEMQNLISYSTAPAGAEVTFKVEAQTEGDRCQIASDDGLPQGQDAGTYRVSWVAKLQGYRDATGSTTVTIAKASPTTGFSKETVSVPYEENGTFDSTEETTLNVADDYNGTITYMSNDTRVASVQGNSLENISLNGTGSATITAVFTETDNYTAATASFRITVGTAETTISYTAEDYSVEYDRTAHGSKITVNSPSEYTIMYSDNNGTSYDLNESPTITDAGDLTIYFQIQADGYNSASGTQKVTVEPKEITANMIAGIAESYTYTGKEITFDDAISVHDEGVLLEKDKDYTITYDDNKEVGKGSVTITGTGNYKESVTKNFEITPVDASDLTASLDRTFGYYRNSETNNATVTVMHGSHTVDSSEITLTVTRQDSTIESGDVVKEGLKLTFNKAGIYTIHVVVAGTHTGTFDLTYTLLPQDVASDDFQVTTNPVGRVWTYDGENRAFGVTVTSGGTSLQKDVDFTLRYTYLPYVGSQEENEYDPESTEFTEAGIYTVIVEGTGNYTGHAELVALIQPRDLSDAGVTATFAQTELVYNGEAQEPGVTLTYNGTAITQLKDTEYYGNTNAGEAQALSAASAGCNNFTGARVDAFTIEKKSLKDSTITAKADPEEYYYTGYPVTPAVTVTDSDRNVDLSIGADYTVTSDAVGPGKVNATVTGTGNYTDMVTVEFTILPTGAEPVETLDLTVTPSEWTWNNGQTKAAISVTFNGKELNDADYELTVSKDGETPKTVTKAEAVELLSAPGKYTITATGVGAYNGSNDAETVTIQKIQPEVTVTATPNSLSGGGKVTLTLKGEKLPAFAEGKDLSSLLTASAKDEKNAPDLSELEWETDEQTGVMTAELTLPNTSETYTFTLTFTGNEYYEAATASEQVVVAQQIISGGGGGPVEDQPANPDDTGVSDWLNTKEHLAYLAGYPGGIFGPDQNMTRAEAAQMFYNLLLEKDVEITVEFEDVPADAWYAKPVNTLASLGILSGVGNGRFDPERSITRAEFTVIAMKFANTSGGGVNIFSDVNEDDWFYSAVVDSTQYGWINGYPDGTFRPEATISRAEVTVIVNHMLGRAADRPYVIAHEEELNTFGDVNRGHWGYFHIAEATNAHEYHTEDGTESWTGLS